MAKQEPVTGWKYIWVLLLYRYNEFKNKKITQMNKMLCQLVLPFVIHGTHLHIQHQKILIHFFFLLVTALLAGDVEYIYTCLIWSIGLSYHALTLAMWWGKESIILTDHDHNMALFHYTWVEKLREHSCVARVNSPSPWQF